MSLADAPNAASPPLDPRLLPAILRRSFASFVRKCTLTLAPGPPFLDNWHQAAIAHRLEQVRLGKLRRLIISLPPRSLKSITASVAFPAFVLGHESQRRILCVSYGQDLTIKHANDFRAITGSSWYRQAFPAMRLSSLKNTEAEVMTTSRGFRLSVSVGGPLTGRGGDLVIIDDPLKPQDAFSAPKRDGVNQWFSNTLLSRLDDKQTGAIVIVMQRVHMEDLVGFVTKLDPGWTILELPAIAEADEIVELGEGRTYHRQAGEALHPARVPLPVLEEIRRQLGSDLFSAQYQQRPVPPGGAMIKRHWVQRYVSLPQRSYRTRIIQSWDTASKLGAENDWSVCTTWQVEDQSYYLVDVERRRLDYPALKALAIKMAELYKPTKLLIEDAGIGTALIQELRPQGLGVIAVKPEGDKVTRMSARSAKFESGQVWLPERARWLDEFEAELFSFPHAKHDDQVDSVSQALGHYFGYTLDNI